MKKIITVLIAIMLLWNLTSCSSESHTHTWVEATCVTPKTCSLCGEITGSVNSIAHEGKLSCKNCELNYFNAFYAYVEEKGVNLTIATKITFTYNTDGKSYDVYYIKPIQSTAFEFWNIYDPITKESISLYFYRDDKHVDKNTHTYYYIYNKLDSHKTNDDRIGGTVKASEISKHTNILNYDSDLFMCAGGHTMEELASDAAACLKILLSAINLKLTKDNVNIRIEHLGFTNFN